MLGALCFFMPTMCTADPTFTANLPRRLLGVLCFSMPTMCTAGTAFTANTPPRWNLEPICCPMPTMCPAAARSPTAARRPHPVTGWGLARLGSSSRRSRADWGVARNYCPLRAPLCHFRPCPGVPGGARSGLSTTGRGWASPACHRGSSCGTPPASRSPILLRTASATTTLRTKVRGCPPTRAAGSYGGRHGRADHDALGRAQLAGAGRRIGNVPHRCPAPSVHGRGSPPVGMMLRGGRHRGR